LVLIDLNFELVFDKSANNIKLGNQINEERLEIASDFEQRLPISQLDRRKCQPNHALN
jgi:hypothetical protein